MPISPSASSCCRSSPAPPAPRAQHAETWLVLFDLYRATGQQQHFESLAIDYAHQFGWSAPQWFSLPKLVADAVADAASAERGAGATLGGEVGWICPELLDIEAVARLRSQTLQMPLPWVFDWAALRRIDAEAATQLSALFRHWSKQQLDMRWMSGEHLFGRCRRRRPTGVRDADPAFWQARLDGAAPGQPGRPVRRGGDRLLRDLRGLAAVVGAHALQCAHRRFRPARRTRRRCRWSARCPPASWNRACSTTPAAARRWRASNCPGSWSATSAKP